MRYRFLKIHIKLTSGYLLCDEATLINKLVVWNNFTASQRQVFETAICQSHSVFNMSDLLNLPLALKRGTTVISERLSQEVFIETKITA
jgi:hypothetical protein